MDRYDPFQMGEWPQDLSQLDPYQPRQFISGSRVGPSNAPATTPNQHRDIFSSLGQYPQEQQEQPYSFMELLSLARPHSLLGTFGRSELLKRQQAKQDYMNQVKQYEDKQQMLLQQANYDSVTNRREEPHYSHIRTRNASGEAGDYFYNDRGPDIPSLPPGTTAYEPTDRSVQPYETFLDSWQKKYGKGGLNEHGQDAGTFWQHQSDVENRKTAAQYRQPPQPNYVQEEFTDENGNTQTRYRNTHAAPPAPYKGVPHKTGVAKPPTDPRQKIMTDAQALQSKLTVAGDTPEEISTKVQAFKLDSMRAQGLLPGQRGAMTQPQQTQPNAAPAAQSKFKVYRNRKTGEVIRVPVGADEVTE